MVYLAVDTVCRHVDYLGHCVYYSHRVTYVSGLDQYVAMRGSRTTFENITLSLNSKSYNECNDISRFRRNHDGCCMG